MDSEQQTERLMQVLRILLRFSKIQNREIEKKLGFSAGYLSRLMSGKIDVKISHVLDLAAVLDLSPHELFAIALPPPVQGPSRGLRQLQRIVPHLVPPSIGGGGFNAPGPDLKALHQKVETGLNEVLRQAFDEVEAETPRRR
jgi:transcriptional regulator with XRE-family HTH domain